MAAKAEKTRRVYVRPRKNKVRHKHKDVIHVLPDILYAGGIAAPFVTSGSGSNGASAYDSVKSAFQGNKAWFQEAAYNTVASVKSNWLEIAALLAGGYVTRYIGKKTNLGKIGTKRLKLL